MAKGHDLGSNREGHTHCHATVDIHSLFHQYSHTDGHADTHAYGRTNTHAYTHAETHPAQKELDRKALTELYHTAGGRHWKNNWSWATDRPLDTWTGVTTDSGWSTGPRPTSCRPSRCWRR